MRLQKGIAAADSKGVNDSLVLVDDIAFIVNVPSNRCHCNGPGRNQFKCIYKY